MIRLELEPYCQDCDHFKADVEKSVQYYADFVFYDSIGDTVIRCRNRHLCGRIKKYLERKKGENNGKNG